MAGPVNGAAEDRERCYGIVEAGQNDCAAAFIHSCAGLATEDYSGAEWAIVPMGTCVEPGSTTAFDGVGGPIDTARPDGPDDGGHG